MLELAERDGLAGVHASLAELIEKAGLRAAGSEQLRIDERASAEAQP